MTFKEMYALACGMLNPRKLNKHCKISDTVCVLETKDSKTYLGISLVATCGVGYCSEQAAITQMLNNGETDIKQLLTIDKFDNILPPCGRCIELITQINPDNMNTNVFVEENKSVAIKELYPFDWKNVKGKGLRRLEIEKNDKYNISRFLEAQKNLYEDILKELKNGRKKTHWMWFVFPQLKELGKSEMSEYYGISCKEEAEQYFKNPILKNRYLECCNVLMNLDTRNANEIFGDIDSIKLLSSLTLFYITSSNEIIREVIDKFYNGNFCKKTIKVLN